MRGAFFSVCLFVWGVDYAQDRGPSSFTREPKPCFPWPNSPLEEPGTFAARLVAKDFKTASCLAMGNDVEQTEPFILDAPASGHHCRQEGFVSISTIGMTVVLPVVAHLQAGLAVEEDRGGGIGITWTAVGTRF